MENHVYGFCVCGPIQVMDRLSDFRKPQVVVVTTTFQINIFWVVILDKKTNKYDNKFYFQIMIEYFQMSFDIFFSFLKY